MTVQEMSDELKTDEADWYGAETSTFGDRLTGAREAAGMSQTELARRLGVSARTVRSWEDDRVEPRANRLQMLSGILNVSITWLLAAKGIGLDAPPRADPAPPEAEAMLRELQNVRTELQRAAEQLEQLQGKLQSLSETAE